jgi:hypothetical protein
MNRTKLLFFLVFLFLFPVCDTVRALAPEPYKTVKLKRGEGILSAMMRGGCDPSQLIAVMNDNGITSDQLGRLPENLPIRLSSQCSTAASPAVANQSTAVVVSDRNRITTIYSKIARDFANQISSLKEAYTNLLSSKNAEVAKLTNQVNALQNENHTLSAQLSSSFYHPTLAQKIEFFLFGLVIASFGWGAYIFVFRKQKVVREYEGVPEKILYNNFGHIRTLQKVSDAKYRCDCSEVFEIHNKERHFARFHEEDRLEQSATIILPLQPLEAGNVAG